MVRDKKFMADYAQGTRDILQKLGPYSAAFSTGCYMHAQSANIHFFDDRIIGPSGGWGDGDSEFTMLRKALKATQEGKTLKPLTKMESCTGIHCGKGCMAAPLCKYHPDICKNQ